MLRQAASPETDAVAKVQYGDCISGPSRRRGAMGIGGRRRVTRRGAGMEVGGGCGGGAQGAGGRVGESEHASVREWRKSGGLGELGPYGSRRPARRREDGGRMWGHVAERRHGVEDRGRPRERKTLDRRRAVDEQRSRDQRPETGNLKPETRDYDMDNDYDNDEDERDLRL